MDNAAQQSLSPAPPAVDDPLQNRRGADARPVGVTTVDFASDLRQSIRAQLAAATQALAVEFAGALPLDTVVRQVDQAREQLLAAGVRAGLATAAEAMARTRLQALRPAHGTGV